MGVGQSDSIPAAQCQGFELCMCCASLVTHRQRVEHWLSLCPQRYIEHSWHNTGGPHVTNIVQVHVNAKQLQMQGLTYA